MAKKVTDSDPQKIIDNCLVDAEFKELPNFYRGKVRDAYDLPDGRRLLIATDRQSAFDQVLAAVPYKGQVLTQTARYWFEVTEEICPNHVVDYPDPNVAAVKKLDMLPIEMVVRDYLTGSTETSIWPMYERGERLLYGHQFSDGLRKNQKLPETIITPTTKAEQGEHDAPITEAEILETGLISEAHWRELSEKSLGLFVKGRELAARQGLILVDTKFEFGLDETGRIVVADEILTPDSSRYWVADSYMARFESGENPESLDKEFLRLWVSAQCDPYNDPIPEIPVETLIEFSDKYIKLFELVTGRKFEKPAEDISAQDRIQQALSNYLPNYF